MRAALLVPVVLVPACMQAPPLERPGEAVAQLRTLLERGRIEEALSVRARMVQRHGRHPRVLLWSATVSMMLWDFDRALGELRRIERDGHRGGLGAGELAGRKGELLFRMGRYGESVAFLDVDARGPEQERRQGLAMVARSLPFLAPLPRGGATELPLLPGPLPELVVASRERRRAFVLDTGSTVTVIGRRMAADLEVSPIVPIGDVRDGTGRAVPAQAGVLPDLALGGMRLGAVPVVIVDDQRLAMRSPFGAPEQPPGGVVGLDLIGRFRFTLDPGRRSVILQAPQGLPQSGTLRCLWLGEAGCVVPVQIEERTLWFKLDTGASHSSLTLEGLEALPGGREPAVARTRRFHSVGGVQVSVQEVRGMHLRLGEVRFRGVDLPVVTRAPLDLFPVHGVLGADLLLQCRWTLDQGRIHVTLQ